MSRYAMLAQAQGGSPPLYAHPLVLFAVIAAIWWFLLIRPQRQQEKKHRAMLEALKPGDKVILSSGIYGAIVQTADKTYRVKIADNVKIEVARSAVQGLQPQEPTAPAHAKES